MRHYPSDSWSSPARDCGGDCLTPLAFPDTWLEISNAFGRIVSSSKTTIYYHLVYRKWRQYENPQLSFLLEVHVQNHQSYGSAVEQPPATWGGGFEDKVRYFDAWWNLGHEERTVWSIFQATTSGEPRSPLEVMTESRCLDQATRLSVMRLLRLIDTFTCHGNTAMCLICAKEHQRGCA